MKYELTSRKPPLAAASAGRTTVGRRAARPTTPRGRPAAAHSPPPARPCSAQPSAPHDERADRGRPTRSERSGCARGSPVPGESRGVRDQGLVDAVGEPEPCELAKRPRGFRADRSCRARRRSAQAGRQAGRVVLFDGATRHSSRNHTQRHDRLGTERPQLARARAHLNANAARARTPRVRPGSSSSVPARGVRAG